MDRSERSAPPITVRELCYDDQHLPALWNSLLERSDARPVTQTLEWQRVWWSTHGRGRLLLLAAERGGETIAIAPLFAEHGMIFFVGASSADYHDVLGTAHEPAVLAELLAAARNRTPDFLGFRLHFIPEYSRTAPALRVAAEQLDLVVYDENGMVAVTVDLGTDPNTVLRSVSRSMRKAEDFFRKAGDFVVRRIETSAEALPLLPEFYEMHVARWRLLGIDSQFLVPARRTFLERWVAISAERGWLRLLHMQWKGATLGIDWNWHQGGTQHSGPWAFAIEHQKRSPGQVLLRQAVLMALEANMHTYDLGLGDEAYKFRLPCRAVACPTIGLYPPP